MCSSESLPFATKPSCRKSRARSRTFPFSRRILLFGRGSGCKERLYRLNFRTGEKSSRTSLSCLNCLRTVPDHQRKLITAQGIPRSSQRQFLTLLRDYAGGKG